MKRHIRFTKRLEKYANNISLIIGKANLLINSKQAHLAIEFLKKYVDLYQSNHLIYESTC